MQMKISQVSVDILNFAKLISVISVICVVFSIIPKVSICVSAISSVPCIATLEACHGLTEWIQKSIDMPLVHESTYLSASRHYIGGHNYIEFHTYPVIVGFSILPSSKVCKLISKLFVGNC